MIVTCLMLYHYPEKVSSFYLFNDVMEKLRNSGHDVNVITPNPVRGINKIDRRMYKKKKIEQEFENQMIYRVNIPFDTNHLKITRGLRSLFVSYFLAKKAVKIKTDLIFVQSDPPVFYAYFVSKFARKKNIPVSYIIQDLYPDIMGKDKGMIYRLLNHYQKKALNQSSHIITISHDIKNQIIKKGIMDNKIDVIHNWPYEDMNHPSSDVSNLFDPKYFYVTYAGNIGYMQNMDIIVSCAKLMSEYQNIKFLFIGDGVRKMKLLEMIEGLDNVMYYPKVDVSSSYEIYEKSSVNLITLNEKVIFAASPSKTSSCLKAKKPMIACVDDYSDYAKLIKDNNIGLVVNPRDPQGLKKAILDIYDKNVSFSDESYRKIYEMLYNKEKNVSKYIEIFHKLIEKS